MKNILTITIISIMHLNVKSPNDLAKTVIKV